MTSTKTKTITMTMIMTMTMIITITKTKTKTGTKTKTKKKTKCSKDPTYAMFLKSSGFKDINYDQTRPDQRRLSSRGPDSKT